MYLIARGAIEITTSSLCQLSSYRDRGLGTVYDRKILQVVPYMVSPVESRDHVSGTVLLIFGGIVAYIEFNSSKPSKW